MVPKFIVICLVNESNEPAEYWLACRNAFLFREDAERYASAISPSRGAIVVQCPRGVDFRAV